MTNSSAPAHVFLPATPQLLLDLSAQRETTTVAAYEASAELVDLIEASGESAADAVEYAEYTALSVAAEDAFAQVGGSAEEAQAAVIVADVPASLLTLESEDDGIRKYTLSCVPQQHIACFFRVARTDDAQTDDDQQTPSDQQTQPDHGGQSAEDDETGPVTWWYGSEELDELAAMLTAE